MVSIHLFLYRPVNVIPVVWWAKPIEWELLCVCFWNLFTLINTKHLFFQVTESYDEVVEPLSVGRVKMPVQCGHNDPRMCDEEGGLCSIVTANWIHQCCRLSHFVSSFSTLRSAESAMYHLLLTLKELCILPTQCIHMFHMTARINSDYFTKHH